MPLSSESGIRDDETAKLVSGSFSIGTIPIPHKCWLWKCKQIAGRMDRTIRANQRREFVSVFFFWGVFVEGGLGDGRYRSVSPADRRTLQTRSIGVIQVFEIDDTASLILQLPNRTIRRIGRTYWRGCRTLRSHIGEGCDRLRETKPKIGQPEKHSNGIG